jgi:hypothetical protein
MNVCEKSVWLFVIVILVYIMVHMFTHQFVAINKQPLHDSIATNTRGKS